MGSDREEEAVVEILKIRQWYLMQMIKHYETENEVFLKRKLMIMRDYGFQDNADENNTQSSD